MKFGIDKIFINLGEDFIPFLDTWKSLIVREGIKVRLKKLIQKDINTIRENI